MAAQQALVDSKLSKEFAQQKSVADAQARALAGHDKDAQKYTDSELARTKKLEDELAGKLAAQKAHEQAYKDNADAFKGIMGNADAASESLEGVRRMAEAVIGPLTIGVAILGAYAAALGTLAKMAISATQEKDQLRSVFDVLNEGNGQQLLDDLEDLAATLPFTSDRLGAWAKGLLAANVKGKALETGIKAIAAATAIMGESGGAATETLIKRLKGIEESGGKVKLDNKFIKQLQAAGINLGDLAKQLGVTPEKLKTMTLSAKQLGDAMQQALIAKGAGPLAKLGNTWSVISAKVQEGFEDAFEDLGDLVGPFMAELQSLASEFFAGGIASKDWSSAVRAALTGAFEVATKFVNFVHKGFLEAQIAILQVRIAIKPLTSALGDLGAGGLAVDVVLYVLKGTLITIAVVLGLVALAVGLIASPFIIAGTAIAFLAGMVSIAGESFGSFSTKVKDSAAGVMSAVSGFVTSAATSLIMLPIEAAKAGLNFVLGLVQAITTGQGPVADAVKALALSAVNAITGALGIKSPSRVMMRMGAYTAEGLAMGITGGAAGVEAAATDTAGAAVGGAAAGATGGRRGGGKGGIVINVEDGAIRIEGAGGDVRALTREALAQVLEEAALQAGL